MLILINENDLQALEKIAYSNYWITILLMFLFLGIVLLKAINANRLKETVFSLFNVSFIETETDEKTSFFDVFQIVIFIFFVSVLSLLIYRFKIYESTNEIDSFSTFYSIFLSLSSYFFLKKVLENIFSYLFMIKKEVYFFLISKYNYLYAVSFLLYISLVLSEYAGFSTSYLLYFSVFLFAVQFVFHIVINKNLIFRELFYFILYICAFEIAPLFILFKLMF